MKKIFKFSVLLMFLTFVISCACMKDKDTVSGKVVSVDFGKDGYTARITTAKNEVYFATISIVNVGGPEKYKKLKEGDEVSLKGEIWKNDNENHIKVTQIVSVK